PAHRAVERHVRADGGRGEPVHGLDVDVEVRARVELDFVHAVDAALARLHRAAHAQLLAGGVHALYDVAEWDAGAVGAGGREHVAQAGLAAVAAVAVVGVAAQAGVHAAAVDAVGAADRAGCAGARRERRRSGLGRAGVRDGGAALAGDRAGVGEHDAV